MRPIPPQPIRMSRDGSIMVLLTEPRLQLSVAQVRLLDVMLESHDAGCAELNSEAVRQHIFGRPRAVYGKGEGLTATQRAVLSRMLRRLVEQGLIEHENREVSLTDFGIEVGREVVAFRDQHLPGENTLAPSPSIVPC